MSVNGAPVIIIDVIIIDVIIIDFRIMLQIIASPTDDSRCIIYDRNMFIVHAIGLT